MRKTPIDFLQIDGVPMLPPDSDMDVSYEDIDASDSGRDETGTMHRVVVRRKVGKWSFIYSQLTDEEYNYIIGMFEGKDSFAFTRPAAGSSTALETVPAYMSQYSITWRNARTGQWRNLKFNIIDN